MAAIPMDKKVLIADFSEVANPKSFCERKYRVVASEMLLRSQKSMPFNAGDMISSRMLLGDLKDPIYVGIDNKKNLQAKSKNDSIEIKTWPQNIRISPDIHSSNIHVVIDRQSTHKEGEHNNIKFTLEVTKDVQKEEELLLWFSEEILALVDMPFLTPKNIAGHKVYRCHNCNENFEYPNPLKMHLLLSCGRESINQIWNKLDKNIKSQLYSENTKTSQYEFFKSSERPSSTNMQSYDIRTLESPRCISEPPVSAFLPYKKVPLTVTNHNKICSLRKLRKTDNIIAQQPLNLSIMSQRPISDLQRWDTNTLEHRVTRSLEELSGNYAADVELFASNWGKLKQGHLCVYCGKVYSRKYGLKIHIRTHTGYKPLKCKFCFRPFGDPSNLNKHVRLHATVTGLTPYACGLCGKLLVRRRDLERHIKSQHSNDEEAQCTILDMNSN